MPSYSSPCLAILHLLEAMALGTPCVGTDVTGMPEVLRNRTTGLMIAQNDPVALADALEEILQDASLRVRVATRSRQLIESEFDIHGLKANK